MSGLEAELLALDGIHCEVAGSGSPVAFTHDGLLHSESWDAQFAAFAYRYRVARWDRRGYGRSPAATEPFSSVEDLAAVVRAMADSPATLVGCSFGAYDSVQCALDHPALVAGLVLVVAGEQDIPDVHAHSGVIEAGIPGARRVVLAGAGHLPHLEVPDAFNRVVREFLAEVG